MALGITLEPQLVNIIRIMPFSIDHVVPWGRTAEEYQAVFSLSAAEQCGRILDCGGGPASFNAELTATWGINNVVSIDPLYALSGRAIEQRIEETFTVVMTELHRNRDSFVWTNVPSIEELGRRRMRAMQRFLRDYPAGVKDGRYINASLPKLPFTNGSFDLALSSHFLFLYSEQLDLSFHMRALGEMLRAATKVRIFPLLQMDGQPSIHLPLVVEEMASHGIKATVQCVPYEFQRGGNQMLCLRQDEPLEPQAQRGREGEMVYL